MEPRGVVDVLRKLLQAHVPGGVVVDLTAVPLNAQVEVNSSVLGELDGSAFFPRAEKATAGLDAFAREGLLLLEGEERLSILVGYPSGRDAIDDVAERTYTRMPAELARRVETIAEPVAIREFSLVRRFRKVATSF